MINESEQVLPVGRHPLDPSNSSVDPISFALERVQTMLIWIDEHYSGFLNKRKLDPEIADSELENLRNANEQAIQYLQRLTELLLSGQSVDDRRMKPKGLCSDTWRRLVTILQERNKE